MFPGDPLGSTRDDDSRVGDLIAARSLAILHKIALNTVGCDKAANASVCARRTVTARNDALLKLVAGWPRNPV